MKILDLGQQPYLEVWQRMRDFTDTRDQHTDDQIWLVEHPAVFTQGQAGKAEHILHASDIPIIQTDRGGQITYHGPGQIVAYILLDIRRANCSIRQLVTHIEQAVGDLLQHYQITGQTRLDAPGVYVDNAKICSLGLRIRRGCSYHGLALNVDMDLQPFSQINPCGYRGMQVTQLADLYKNVDISLVKKQLIDCLQQKLH